MSDSITNIQIANKESNYSDYIRLVLIGKTGNGNKEYFFKKISDNKYNKKFSYSEPNCIHTLQQVYSFFLKNLFL